MKREDPLLKDVYGLVAFKQHRRQELTTRKKRTPFVSVLKKIQAIAKIADPDAQADRMWERLFELALFIRSRGVHRKPTDVLKAFLKPASVGQERLSKQERSTLTRTFNFLEGAYASSGLAETRLATDYTHFYIMVTSLLATDLLDQIDHAELAVKLTRFGEWIGLPLSSPPIHTEEMTHYLNSEVCTLRNACPNPGEVNRYG